MSDPWGPPEGERKPDPSQPAPAQPPWGQPPPRQPSWGQPAPGQPPQGQPPQSQPSWGQPSYGQPSYGQPGYAGSGGSHEAQTETNAVIALVCAVLAWTFCPVILAIVALVLASNAERNIAESGGTKTGESLVKASRIVSWINIGVFGTLALLFVLLVSLGAGAFF